MVCRTIIFVIISSNFLSSITCSTLSFSCGGSTFEVAYKTTYADVSEGAWVAFLNWDDKLRFARNRANAAETAVCKLDDAVTVSKAG